MVVRRRSFHVSNRQKGVVEKSLADHSCSMLGRMQSFLNEQHNIIQFGNGFHHRKRIIFIYTRIIDIFKVTKS